MPKAFAKPLNALAKEVAAGVEGTPDMTRKRQAGAEASADVKGTPPKKQRASKFKEVKEASTKTASEQVDKASPAETPLNSSTSRAELASREQSEEVVTEPKGKAKAKAARRKKSDLEVAEDVPAEPKKGRKAKPVGPYTQFKEAGCIPEPSMLRKECPTGATCFKAISWNIGGLRAFARNRPDALPDLVKAEQPDVLGIMEHKLQEGAADTETTMSALLDSLPDYEKGELHCSTAKKGYSGTLILLRKDGPKPLSVKASDLPSAKDEGRLITVEYDKLFVVLAYVPNSGDGLKRLDERLGQWDVQLREMLQGLAAKKPTLLIGDLNVAHRDVDIWNVEAPHVPKSAGTTFEERGSFSSLLDAGFADGFAEMHPEELGAFTYWSVRAGNRPKNKGLRLDYAIVSRSFLPAKEEASKAGEAPSLIDVFHMPELCPGDHCPVGALFTL